MDQSVISNPLATEREEEPGLDVRHYLGIVLAHKWSILGIGLLAALIGLYVALKATPVYQSTARLQIERDVTSSRFADAVAMFYYNKEFYATQYELIHSWGVAELAAERLGLLQDLEPSPAPSQEAGFRWSDLVPEALRKPERSVSREQVRAGRIAALQGSIRVTPLEGSQLATISIMHTDPEMAAQRANAVADAYIDFLKDKNLENLESDQNWYASRLDQARQDMDQANRALQAYYENQGLLQSAEGAGSIQSQRLQSALQGQTTAQTERQGLERIYRDIDNARSGIGSLETISELESRGVVRGLKSAVLDARRTISELSQRYGPKHPRMIEAQNTLANATREYQAELERVADTVVSDYRRAQAAEGTYTNQVEAAKAEIRALDRNLAERQKLEEAAASAKEIFERLQSGERTAGMLGSGSQKPNVTVIERARPNFNPVRPNRERMVLLAAFIGLALGVGLAFLLDHLDNTFRGAPEIEGRLGLPLLGSLPKLKLDKGEQLAPMREFASSGKSAFSESIRTIRTGTMLAGLDRASNVIMVTSSVPGEGKTTLSLNLAHALSHMHKTLLIDADMRRPMVGRAHGRARQEPGLSGFVTNQNNFEECVTRLEDSDLTIMHSGVVPPNPLELLGSARFAQVLQELRGQYQYIVVDCAPALAVSDALMLSKLVDAVLYVIKADSTPHQAATEGVQRLRRVDAPLMGAVLNQVSTGGKPYYHYGKYYRYGYYHQYDYPGYYGEDKRA